MTLDQLSKSNRPTVDAVDISGVLECDPQYIRDAAKTCPATLGFPVVVMQSRVKIPRIPFLKFMGVEV